MTTIAGMLDRNLKYVAETKNALGLIVADAQQRIDNLSDHEERWRVDYVEASAAFDGAKV